MLLLKVTMLFLVVVNVGKETIAAFESYNFIVVHQIKHLNHVNQSECPLVQLLKFPVISHHTLGLKLNPLRVRVKGRKSSTTYCVPHRPNDPSNGTKEKGLTLFFPHPI